MDRQIAPFRICGLDQLDLPGALPRFQCLLANDRFINRCTQLGVN